jgi:UPF0755 protein
MRGIVRFIGALIFLGLVAVVVAFSWLMISVKSPGPLAAATLMVIEPGTGTQGTAQLLADRSVIANIPAFYVGLMVGGDWGKIKAGEYEFATGISTRAVIDQLVEGRVYARSITIPEGRSVAEIIALVEAAPGLTGAVTTIPDQGRLLPETYQYHWGQTRQSIIDRMQASMTALVEPLWAGRPAEFPLASIDQVLTLASIIEKETGQADERPQVASVFFNRLQVGMKLQSDPTVIYAITKGQAPLGRPLLIKDLEETDSPYNTYRYGGLPPGPIANPGAASIRAVFAPAQTDYFYFVADGTGGHAFARSLDEHNRNVQQWRAIQRSAAGG